MNFEKKFFMFALNKSQFSDMGDFNTQWKFESEIRSGYPENFVVRYGEPYQSKSGKATLSDWIVNNGRKDVAIHTMMFMTSKAGNQYVVVSVKQKPKPVSSELKAIMNKAAEIRGY